MKLKVRLFGKNAFSAEKEIPKKIDMKNYYLINVICKNCNQSTSIAVKKGVHINDVITGVRCKFCECRLEKQENK
jgi:hypothetical protein